MRVSGWSFLICGVVAVVSCGMTVSARAQTFTVLTVFNGTNALQPDAPFVQGTDGNFYNVSLEGGVTPNGNGDVFYVTPAGEATDLYNFCMTIACVSGLFPNSLTMGKDGNFYGTATNGGLGSSGTVFEVTPSGSETTLLAFCFYVCLDGNAPNGVIQGSNGSFYGTATLGGRYNGGTFFELTPPKVYKVIYAFCALQCNDGANPVAPPIQAANGNFYGTTAGGGSYNGGVVYEITASGSYKVLHNFCSQTNCPDGEIPNYLVQDASGNLYGTAGYGGDPTSYGTIFKLTPANLFTVLHTFKYTDGIHPLSGLIVANDGNLYGTTSAGGSGGGTVFQITPGGAFTVLYSFCSDNVCPASSPNGLFQGTDGILYGTTKLAPGNFNNGEAFSFSNNLSPLVETVPTIGKVGTRVIILGNNLTGSSSVTFNGVAAAFTVESDTYIEATVPTSATTGTVSVDTPSGTLKSNPQFVVAK